MIRLGLRLTLTGGREALARLALITTAVAIGVGLLLTTLASVHAVHRQNSRYAWLETGFSGSDAPAVEPAGTRVPGQDLLWWRLRADYYQGTRIGRVDLAATGPDAPVPPGIAALPGPGQFYASPVLSALIRARPAAELADRFPGVLTGTIGPAALPAPNALIIIIGHRVAELSSQPDAVQVARISTTVPSSCRSGSCAPAVGIDANGVTLILSVVVAALLFPVLIFIGGATRLSAARREQRFAAMRLVGATPAQISVLSTVESCVAAAVGVVLGFGLFAVLRPTLARIPFTGDPFFRSDLSLSVVNVLLVGLGIPIGAAVAARLALRRVAVSPLGVTRRVTPRPPTAWRALPLLVGLGWLADLAFLSDLGGVGPGKDSTQQAAAYLFGILVTMAGLVLAGPWLTMLGSRLMVRHATGGAGLIAGRRLSDNPMAAFRAISGLVLALFVGSCALGIISTIDVYNAGSAGHGASSPTTLVQSFDPGSDPVASTPPDVTVHTLGSIPGVTGVTVVRIGEAGRPGHPPVLLASCVELSVTPALGRCPGGAQTVTIDPDYGGGVIDTTDMSQITWPAAGSSADELRRYPVDSLVVGTDGSRAAIERSRTVLARDHPGRFTPQTLSEIKAERSRELDGYRRLADVVILGSLPIAGCSLAVGIAGGLADRKRPFSLLRLTGVSLGLLRRIITLEAAAPLLIGAALSIGTGLLTAYLFLRAQLSETLQPPSLDYWLIVVAGLLASLAIIASTLPLLRRMTGPEVARND